MTIPLARGVEELLNNCVEMRGDTIIQHWHSQGQCREIRDSNQICQVPVIAHGTADEVAKAKNILRRPALHKSTFIQECAGNHWLDEQKL